MILIPDHILNLKAYLPGKSADELKAEFGFDKMAVLWNNENNFGSSPKAKQAMQDALSQTYLYPDPTSNELRKLIADKVGKRIEHIAVENGSESILNNIFQAYFFDGDELLTSDGSFVAVYIWAQAHNIDVTKIPLTKDYSFNLDQIQKNISNKTKAIYIANPNNPTGSIIPKLELRQFVEDIPEDILIIIDEAYFEYAQDLSSDYPNSIKFSKPNVITLRTFSKAYGVAGIRIGYAVGSPEVIEALNKLKMTFAPSNLAQAAGKGAIKDELFLNQIVANNTKWISKFNETFTQLGLKFYPTGGNFIMIDMKTEERAFELTMLLAQQGVFIRHLKSFALPNCIRITIGKPEDNQYFVEKLKEVYPQLLKEKLNLY